MEKKRWIMYNNWRRWNGQAAETCIFAALFFWTAAVLIGGRMIRKQSYREQQEAKKNVLIAAGLVSERFPGVSNIELHMTYYQKTADPVLMKRTVSFCPTNYAFFRMDCMRDECTNGGFDLAPVVASQVKNRKPTVKGNINCHGKTENLGHGHASIAYEINIRYSRNGKS
jgi:hypothetical protein